jgi:DNA gyrase/topoisomerase IV subunit A
LENIIVRFLEIRKNIVLRKHYYIVGQTEERLKLLHCDLLTVRNVNSIIKILKSSENVEEKLLEFAMRPIKIGVDFLDNKTYFSKSDIRRVLSLPLSKLTKISDRSLYQEIENNIQQRNASKEITESGANLNKAIIDEMISVKESLRHTGSRVSIVQESFEHLQGSRLLYSFNSEGVINPLIIEELPHANRGAKGKRIVEMKSSK